MMEHGLKADDGHIADVQGGVYTMPPDSVFQ
jgi:hypothetical protein